MKTPKLVSLFILLILCLCNSPEKPEVPKGISMHIEGVVTSDLPEKKIKGVWIYTPIEGALITVKDWGQVLFQVSTDHEGFYSIKEYYQPWHEGNNFSIMAEKQGYYTKLYPEYAGDPRQPRYTEELQKIDFKLRSW